MPVPDEKKRLTFILILVDLDVVAVLKRDFSIVSEFSWNGQNSVPPFTVASF